MTQLIYFGNNVPQYNDLFAHHSPKPLVTIDIISDLENLIKANKELGLALDQGEIDYLINAFKEIIGRNPTDVELFMFAQVNSEHCRHKIFNADWTIDGTTKELSLFKMIKILMKKLLNILFRLILIMQQFSKVMKVMFGLQILRQNNGNLLKKKFKL